MVNTRFNIFITFCGRNRFMIRNASICASSIYRHICRRMGDGHLRQMTMTITSS